MKYLISVIILYSVSSMSMADSKTLKLSSIVRSSIDVYQNGSSGILVISNSPYKKRIIERGKSSFKNIKVKGYKLLEISMN